MAEQEAETLRCLMEAMEVGTPASQAKEDCGCTAKHAPRPSDDTNHQPVKY